LLTPLWVPIERLLHASFCCNDLRFCRALLGHARFFAFLLLVPLFPHCPLVEVRLFSVFWLFLVRSCCPERFKLLSLPPVCGCCSLLSQRVGSLGHPSPKHQSRIPHTSLPPSADCCSRHQIPHLLCFLFSPVPLFAPLPVLSVARRVFLYS